ncbi:GEVED domain-containing protein [Blastopirellula retiformator]|uniref:Bacillopeptidase F n=1 Tax=Blastopirellula retiformator TaxID=2527970 RepID=A0A5C5V0V5_9BACT|nr:GEVED domain-containing protein [Blastopirellula retiformator]TWT31427.1 Bacillopeptidase F precursor [Blastopirellula retiformator]
MKRSSRKPKNRLPKHGSQAKFEALEARMVMDAAGYEAALDSFMGTDRVGRDGPLAVLGWNLTVLYHDGEANSSPIDPDAPTDDETTSDPAGLRELYEIDSENRILLDIAAFDTAGKNDLIAGLGQLGFVQMGQLNNTVSGFLPISSLADLAALPSLGGVSASIVKTHVGSVDSQGDASMLTDEVRAEYGYDGAGQKIGVLSDSYNALGGEAADIATGDLPGAGNPEGYTTPVQVLQDYISIDSSDEGRGMMQLVHDVAPAADLAFTTAFTGKAGFAQGIYDLAAAGSTVIVDDVGYANEPWFSDGMIALAADSVVQNNVAYFTSAGNSARESYESDYRVGNTYNEGDFASATGAPTFFGGTSHDFDPGSGVDDRQSITLAPQSFVTLTMQWDDTFLTDGGIASSSVVDIYVLSGNTVVAGGTDLNVDAFEGFNVINATDSAATYDIMIVSYSGDLPTRLKYVQYRGAMAVNEYDTASGTALGHSNAEYAMSIGAAYYLETPVFGTAPAAIESFSSAGGTPILLDQAGNHITPNYRQTVDVVGPDGSDTTFFGGGDSDATGFPNFFGTSAAAPHVAALAALMRQANTSLSALEVNDILRETATDMDDPTTSGFDVGFDTGTGYGYVNGIEAVLGAIFAGADTIGSPDACGVYTGPAAIEVHAGLGANLFVTGHSVLDNGVDNGQQGFDYEILDFLRGEGTDQEIAADDYSIAIIGNDTVDWGFSTGTHTAIGYESTSFYDIDDITPLMWIEILSKDALIILSDLNAMPTEGLDDAQVAKIVSAKSNIAAAINSRGIDIWAGGGSLASGYYDFLPAGSVDVADLGVSATPYDSTVIGESIGVTDPMVNAAEAYSQFTAYDANFFEVEQRDAGETISLLARNVAFADDVLVQATEETEILMHGVIGYKFHDVNQDGIRQSNEPGLAGFTYFIDENGDGKIGLCEPAAVTDENGMFTLYPRNSGTFNILQVTEPGYYDTDEISHVIEVDGDRITINAPLISGAIPAIDYGDAGMPYAAHPVVDGLQLGESPLVDDGVVFGSGLKIGTNTVTIDSSTVLSTALLQGFMDFNKDGDFDDAGEQIFKNLQLKPGIHTYTFTIPNTVIDDSALPEAYRIAMNARFRIDYTQNLGPTGVGFAGEVEDYQLFVAQDPESGLFLNDDAFTYEEDTADQTYDVLANDKTFFNRTITLTSVTSETAGVPSTAFTIVGNKIVFDATGILDVGEDIVVEYEAIDSAGFTSTAKLTLKVAGTPISSSFNSTAFVNTEKRGDVNKDGVVTTHDLAIILYELKHNGPRALPQVTPTNPNFNQFIDVNGDGLFSSLDVTAVLSALSRASREREREREAVDVALAAEETPILEATTPVLTESAFATSSPIVTSSSSTPSSNVTPYLAGVLEKSSDQKSLLDQESEPDEGESNLEGELTDYLYPSDSLDFRLIESTSTSTLLDEDVESTIDEIAIDVEAAWEEDLISG